MAKVPSLRVLVLGGYGQFGERICRICQTEVKRRGLGVQLLVAGRSTSRAERLVHELNHQQPVELWSDYSRGRSGACHSHEPHEAMTLDVHADGALRDALVALRPELVVNTVGPFQDQDYAVAKTCIEAGCHYVDISDAREWVSGFVEDTSIRRLCEDRGVMAVAGLSTVPSVTVSVVDSVIGDFETVDSIQAGISVSGKARPGEATIRAILGYAGKPFRALENGRVTTRYGWQNLHRWTFPPPYGRRWQGRGDVPELDVLPARYSHLGLKSVDFHFGLENWLPHLAVWAGSWAVRVGLVRNLAAYTPPLQALKTWLSNYVLRDTYKSIMYVQVTGRRRGGGQEEEDEEEEGQAGGAAGAMESSTVNLLVASRGTAEDPRQQQYYRRVGDHYQGDGPNIPCIPSVLLMRRFAAARHANDGDHEAAAGHGLRPAGAYSGVDFFSFAEFMDLASEQFDITSSVEIASRVLERPPKEVL